MMKDDEESRSAKPECDDHVDAVVPESNPNAGTEEDEDVSKPTPALDTPM